MQVEAWQFVAGFNLLIVACYTAIGTIIFNGLVRTRQLRSNALAAATGTIFITCAVHHLAHTVHIIIPEGSASHTEAIRAAFGAPHHVVIDAVGAIVAVTYLALRRSYTTLLHTPAMFDDAVRSATEAELRRVAFTDQLTDVPNRASYQRLADALPDDATPVTVMFLDLDGFKSINDHFGHDAGDRLLRDVALRLSRATDGSEQEHLFRLGGDEFLAVGIGLDARRTRAFVARVGAALADSFPVREGDVSISASIGTAHGTGHDGADVLVRRADAAMYELKIAAHGSSAALPVIA